MKRIFFVSNVASALVYRIPLAEALRKRGWMVVFAAFDDGHRERIVERGFHFFGLQFLQRRGTNPYIDFLLFCELLHLYRVQKPDFIVHFSIKPNIYGSIASGIHRIPSIAIMTGLGHVFIQASVLQKLVCVFYRFAFYFVKKVVVQNVDDRDLLIENSIAKKTKIKIIESSGVDIDYFTQTFCAERDIKSGGYAMVFLLCARLTESKGVRDFVSAAALVREKVPSAVFMLVGDIDYSDNSITDKELSLWVEKKLVMHSPYVQDVRPLYCSADVIVLPSYYREGIPRVLLEGMAMGKPVITTDTPGCREILREGTAGFLIPPRNSRCLADKMLEYINMTEEKRYDMQQAARLLVATRFEQGKIIDQYLKMLAEYL